jgi:hypothetical protein
MINRTMPYIYIYILYIYIRTSPCLSNMLNVEVSIKVRVYMANPFLTGILGGLRRGVSDAPECKASIVRGKVDAPPFG